MIKYRPHRRTLDEAMAEMQTFETSDQMLEYVADNSYGLFTKDDLTISDDFGKDNRINWRETRYICTQRFGEVKYDVPQCIGMCSFED